MKKIIFLLIAVFTIGDVVYAGFPITEKQSISIVDEECDNIILKDGREISAKIIEITPDFVKYKKCNNLDGPLHTIYKSDILMLRYTDGTKDIIINNNKDRSQELDEKVYNFLGALSIMFGLFSFVIFGIVFAPLGVVLGLISLVLDEDKLAGAIGLSISVTALFILLVLI